MRELTNDMLHEKTVLAATTEKSATLALLEHLAEIDRRRLYAIRGYQSLWEYVHKALDYSERQTTERVAAMRLIVRVPEVRAELEAGRLSLTTTASLGMHVRREKLRPEETVALLREVTGKSSREVERVLVADSHEPKRPESIRPITKELTRITLDVDQEFIQVMNRMKELHGNPASMAEELFLAAMKEYTKRREPKTQRAALVAPEVRVTPATDDAAAQMDRKQTRYIPKPTRDFIRIRSGDRCEYVDPETRRRCECRTGLEFDHIKPYALEGGNEAANLRHYCAAHNRLAALVVWGEEKMGKFLC